MKVVLTPKFGDAPIEIDVSQLVAFLNNGAPALVIGEFGPPGAVKIAKATDPDFNAVLAAFGHKPVTVLHTADQTFNNATLVGGPGISSRKY